MLEVRIQDGTAERAEGRVIHTQSTGRRTGYDPIMTNEIMADYGGALSNTPGAGLVQHEIRQDRSISLVFSGEDALITPLLTGGAATFLQRAHFINVDED